MYIDAHCHCHELPINILERISKENKILLVCVSDDVKSSELTIELSHKYRNVLPCIGIHPWSIDEAKLNDIQILEKLINKYEVRCLGEIGLDTKFVPKTIVKQRVFFNEFIRLAKEYDLAMNIHAAGTWREVYEQLVKNDIARAYVHWYTGPIDIIDKFLETGYKIGINPAWKIQKKHRDVINYAPLNVMVTESDAPYEYRGLSLTPDLVIETIEYVSKVKKLSREYILSVIEKNFQEIFR